MGRRKGDLQWKVLLEALARRKLDADEHIGRNLNLCVAVIVGRVVHTTNESNYTAAMFRELIWVNTNSICGLEI